MATVSAMHVVWVWQMPYETQSHKKRSDGPRGAAAAGGRAGRTLVAGSGGIPLQSRGLRKCNNGREALAVVWCLS